MKILLSLFTLITLNLIACNRSGQPATSASPTGIFTSCKDPRPQRCTREFRPVCAQVDTGVRCVTTPCPSSENKTYSTACTACSDKKVNGYWKNACSSSKTTSDKSL